MRALSRPLLGRPSLALACLAWLPLGLVLSLSSGCKPEGTVDPSITQAKTEGAFAIHEALELRIDAGEVSEADRAAALEAVRGAEDDGSAGHAFARASVAGRVAQERGLKALGLLEEMQTWARKSIERDPEFEGGAARRLLGTLYVLAGDHLEEGDSEEGLELLEEVLDAHPDEPVNHLRLAEGYIALGDPDPAIDSLCAALGGREGLRREERALLDHLLEDVGGASSLGCPEESP